MSTREVRTVKLVLTLAKAVARLDTRVDRLEAAAITARQVEAVRG